MPVPFAQLAVASVLLGGSAPASHDDDAIEILDAGDPATAVQFVTVPDVGDTATVAMVQTVRGRIVETTVWLDEPRTDSTVSLSSHVEIDVEVVDVDDDGFVLRGEVVSFTARDRSDDPFIADSYDALGAYESLVGETLDLTYDLEGTLDDVDAAPGTSLDDVQDDALWDIFSPDLSSIVPDEAVGTGAEWTFTEPGGVSLRCRLAATGDRYQVDASADADPEMLTELFGPTLAHGDIKFGAEYVVSGDPSNALDYQRSEDVHMAVDFSSGSDRGSMDITVSMRTTLTPS